MRYQYLSTKRVLQIRKASGIAAGMAPKWMIPLILGAMLAMPQVTHAYSFGGSDWLLDMAGTFYVRSTLGDSDDPFNEVDIPSTINQVSNSSISIPITIPDPLNLTIYATGNVSGTHFVTNAYISQTAEIQTDAQQFVGVVVGRQHLVGHIGATHMKDTL